MNERTVQEMNIGISIVQSNSYVQPDLCVDWVDY
jgi:hypothetical protein